ncbi:MAG: hypothetical protein ACXWK7_05300 [Caulobacteraceae bacterium]
MGHGHPSRLVTLGENLAALTEAGTLIAMGMAGLAGALIRAPFREPRSSDFGCGCQSRSRCCYDPPVHRCGGW